MKARYRDGWRCRPGTLGRSAACTLTRTLTRTLACILTSILAGLALPVAAAERITLAQALDLALARNADLEQQRAGLDRAAGVRKQTLQGILPTLSASTGYLRSDSALLEAVPVFDPQAPPQLQPGFVDLRPVEAQVAAVQIVQPLVNLEAWQARTQSGLRQNAAGHALARGRQELVFQVMSQYYGITAMQLRAQAERRARAAAERALSRAESMFEQGLVPPADVLSARAQVTDVEAQLAQTEGGIISGKAQLRRLIGLDVPTDLVLVDAIPEPAPVVVEPDVGSAEIAHLVARRQDLQARQESLKAAQAGVDLAQAAYFPRLNAVGRYQWLKGYESIRGTQRGWVLGVSLDWTFFAGGSLAGAVDVARADAREAEAQLQSLRRQADAEVESSLATWRAAWRSWQSARLASRDASAALAQREGRYREGLGTLSELLQSQAGALAAEARQAEARYRAFISARQYALATGQDLLAEVPR